MAEANTLAYWETTKITAFKRLKYVDTGMFQFLKIDLHVREYKSDFCAIQCNFRLELLAGKASKQSAKFFFF
jgi:hypothetical protein